MLDTKKNAKPKHDRWIVGVGATTSMPSDEKGDITPRYAVLLLMNKCVAPRIVT